MSDEQPTGPHARAPEEGPEQHIGRWTRDPWDDPAQGDWPTEHVDIANGRVSS